MVPISIVNGVYKPTYNWGVPSTIGFLVFHYSVVWSGHHPACSRPCFCKRATYQDTGVLALFCLLGDGVVTSFFDVFIEWPTSPLAHAQVANYATRSSLDTSFCERTNVVLKPTVTFGLGLVESHYRDGPSLFTSEQLTWSLPDGETLA